MSGSGVGTRPRPAARTLRSGGPGRGAIDPRIHARRRAVRMTRTLKPASTAGGGAARSA